MARELGCDWHTVNDAVLAYGGVLVDDPGRFGSIAALGLDEVLFVRDGPFHRPHFSTSIVDVGRGQLLDVVPGRSGVGPRVWLAEQGSSPARIGRSSTRWCRMPPRSPIRSMS